MRSHLLVLKKKSLRLTVLFFSISTCMLFVGCTRCSQHGNRHRDRGILGRDVVNIYIEDYSSYSAGMYIIQAGYSMQEVVFQNNPKLLRMERESTLGGSKLIGEMSADAAGISVSRPSETSEIPIGTPSELKLRSPKDPDNIVIGILKKELNVYVEPIESCGLIEGIRDIFSGEATSPLRVIIDVTNTTQISKHVVIECGQMIESESEDVQNLVVCKREVSNIPPGSTVTMTVKCMCAAHYRKSPIGSAAKLTPWILDAPPSVFEKQQRVWNFLERIKIDAKQHKSTMMYRGNS